MNFQVQAPLVPFWHSFVLSRSNNQVQLPVHQDRYCDIDQSMFSIDSSK